MDQTVRRTAVAGAFYPGTRREFESSSTRWSLRRWPTTNFSPVLPPHAGYVYSGGVAGRLFAHLTVPRRVVVL